MRRWIGTTISVLLAVLGLGGIRGDLEGWAGWLRWLNSTNWRAALVIIAVVLFLVAWDVPQRLWQKVGRLTKRGEERPKFSTLPTVAIEGGVGGKGGDVMLTTESKAESEKKSLLSKVDEFERRGALLSLQLSQEMQSAGSRIRPHLRALLDQWASDGNLLFERIDAVVSAMFLTDRPPKVDRYDGRLWEGYLNRRLGHVRQIKDAIKRGDIGR